MLAPRLGWDWLFRYHPYGHCSLFRCLPHPNPMFPLGPASSSTSRTRLLRDGRVR